MIKENKFCAKVEMESIQYKLRFVGIVVVFCVGD